MGNIDCFAIISNGIKVIKFSSTISPLVGGLALGIIFLLLIIIGGFFIYRLFKTHNNDIEDEEDFTDEDRSLGKNKGIVKANRDQ